MDLGTHWDLRPGHAPASRQPSGCKWVVKDGGQRRSGGVARGGPAGLSSGWHHPDIFSRSSSPGLCNTSFWRMGKRLGGQDTFLGPRQWPRAVWYKTESLRTCPSTMANLGRERLK